MPERGSSPSAGWEETYAAMDVGTDAESFTDRSCPNCGTPSPQVTSRVFRCPDHGPWIRAESTP